MVRLIDKICAIWCIIVSKEYVIFTCNKFTKAKNSKCWASMGIWNKSNYYNIFLDVVKDYINVFKNK